MLFVSRDTRENEIEQTTRGGKMCTETTYSARIEHYYWHFVVTSTFAVVTSYIENVVLIMMLTHTRNDNY